MARHHSPHRIRVVGCRVGPVLRPGAWSGSGLYSKGGTVSAGWTPDWLAAVVKVPVARNAT